MIVVFIVWWARRPLYHRGVKPRDFQKFLGVLVTDSVDGSLLFIQHEGSEKFVQFAKYGDNQQQSVLRFGFPDAPWSRQYFEPMVEMFKKMGIPFDIVTTGEELVRRFLEINLKDENIESKTSKATQIAMLAFEVMGLTECDTYKVNFEAKLSIEAARPSLEALRDAPNKLVRSLSRHYLRKLDKTRKERRNDSSQASESGSDKAK